MVSVSWPVYTHVHVDVSHLISEDCAFKVWVSALLLCAGLFTHQHVFKARLDASSPAIRYADGHLLPHDALLRLENLLVPGLLWTTTMFVAWA